MDNHDNPHDDVKYERIFCAEQINVPTMLPAILKDYTKQVIRSNPTKGQIDPDRAKALLYEWSYQYFTQQLKDAKIDNNTLEK